MMPINKHICLPLALFILLKIESSSCQEVSLRIAGYSCGDFRGSYLGFFDSPEECASAALSERERNCNGDREIMWSERWFGVSCLSRLCQTY